MLKTDNTDVILIPQESEQKPAIVVTRDKKKNNSKISFISPDTTTTITNIESDGPGVSVYQKTETGTLHLYNKEYTNGPNSTYQFRSTLVCNTNPSISFLRDQKSFTYATFQNEFSDGLLDQSCESKKVSISRNIYSASQDEFAGSRLDCMLKSREPTNLFGTFLIFPDSLKPAKFKCTEGAIFLNDDKITEFNDDRWSVLAIEKLFLKLFPFGTTDDVSALRTCISADRGSTISHIADNASQLEMERRSATEREPAREEIPLSGLNVDKSDLAQLRNELTESYKAADRGEQFTVPPILNRIQNYIGSTVSRARAEQNNSKTNMALPDSVSYRKPVASEFKTVGETTFDSVGKNSTYKELLTQKIEPVVVAKKTTSKSLSTAPQSLDTASATILDTVGSKVVGGKANAVEKLQVSQKRGIASENQNSSLDYIEKIKNLRPQIERDVNLRRKLDQECTAMGLKVIYLKYTFGRGKKVIHLNSDGAVSTK